MLEEGNNYLSESVPDAPYKLITRRIDTPKIRNSFKKDIKVNTSYTRDVKIVREKNPIRSGAIIYTKYEGKTYFCLGVDTSSGDLTDFSGGVTKGETIVEGGLRELEEESLGVFGHLTGKDVGDSVAIHCHNMMTMFIYLDINMDSVCKTFRDRVKDMEEPEVCNIVWLETKDFLESIHGKGQKLYVRVRRMLSKCVDKIKSL
jgi:hypothetical protein